jgi:DNA invertase Pin-like site-specific DNA recombinase
VSRWRVSTVYQNLVHQVDALRRVGVSEENIYVDVASGAKASRPKFDLVMKLLRSGDTLKVTRLDRLGRSVLHLSTSELGYASAAWICTSSSRA